MIIDKVWLVIADFSIAISQCQKLVLPSIKTFFYVSNFMVTRCWSKWTGLIWLRANFKLMKSTTIYFHVQITHYTKKIDRLTLIDKLHLIILFTVFTIIISYAWRMFIYTDLVQLLHSRLLRKEKRNKVRKEKCKTFVVQLFSCTFQSSFVRSLNFHTLHKYTRRQLGAINIQ